MNRKSKKNIGLLSIVVLVLLSSPGFGLGRAGRGDGFMRAFGMTVKGDSFVSSYGIWSSRLVVDTGLAEVGPVAAQFGEGFEDIVEVQHRISLGVNNILTISGYQVWYSFLPYSYKGYRGYR